MNHKGKTLLISMKTVERDKIHQEIDDLKDFYKKDASGLIKYLISKEHYLIRKSLNQV
jgi:hypothetical protein